MEPDVDKLPEAFRDAHSVDGAWLFGRIVREPVGCGIEAIYRWEGGPLAFDTLDRFNAVHRLWTHQLIWLDGEPRVIRPYRGDDGKPVCFWARVEQAEVGPRIVGWPDEMAVPKGYVR